MNTTEVATMPSNTEDRTADTEAASDALTLFRAIIREEEAEAALMARTEARRRFLYAQLDERARRGNAPPEAR